MRKPNGYWNRNIEHCREEALKYNSRKEFSDNSVSAYNAAIANNWLDEICNHMDIKKYNGYWNKERCQEEALKYNGRKKFQLGSGSAFSAAKKNGWIEEICSHMLKIGNRHNKCIYCYEFSDNHVYVGLTYDIENRKNRRINDEKDAVTKYIKKTNLIPKIIQLTDYILVDEAIKMEEYYINKYKNEGWILLNRTKTGSIGGNVIKWTDKLLYEITLKYDNFIEFKRKEKHAYDILNKRKEIDKFCSHMKRKI
jgi:hypothetical protein